MSHPSPPLLPLFLKLDGRAALVVGGGAMAAVRVRQLVEAGARVTVVAPEVRAEIARDAAVVRRRPFAPADLDGAWLAVAAATPEVNRAVAAAAEERRIFVNAVDDPSAASAYTAGVVREHAIRATGRPRTGRSP
jgi:uroporphyrin-III C-methyltransferase/precorrin-2 dehydrogenase/sirohydrochlorin ferrochelatase